MAAPEMAAQVGLKEALHKLLLEKSASIADARCALDMLEAEAIAANATAASRRRSGRVGPLTVYTSSLVTESMDLESKKRAKIAGVKAWRGMAAAEREHWKNEAQRINSERCGMFPVTSVVVQDSWDDEDDQELLAFLKHTGLPTSIMSAKQILELTISPEVMLFADSSVVQQLIPKEVVADTYPECFESCYHRRISRGSLDSLIQTELPFFVKPADEHKVFAARMVRTSEQLAKLQTDVPGSTVVYVCDEREFSSEFRLFIGETGPGAPPDEPALKVWSCREYSEHMVSHRLNNSTGATTIVIDDVKPPQQLIDQLLEIVRANRFGFVVVDIGWCKQTQQWSVVEVNPPFALSDYGFDIDGYVGYCTQAWVNLVKKTLSLRHPSNEQPADQE